MRYYNVGKDEAKAKEAAEIINTKWGCPIVCVNAATREPDPTAQKTEEWGDAELHPDGCWKIPEIPVEVLKTVLVEGKITQNDINEFVQTYVLSIDEV